MKRISYFPSSIMKKIRKPKPTITEKEYQPIPPKTEISVPYINAIPSQNTNTFSLGTIKEVLTKLQTVVTHPLVASAVMAVLLVGVSASNSFAAKDLKSVVNDFSSFIYTDIRFAVCILGIAFAGVRFWSRDDTGRKQALFIIVGVGVIAFAPGIIKYISELTQTTLPTGSFQ